MIFYLVAFGLLLHVAWWGAGLAIVGMPRRWRRFWPMLCFPAGFALQSAVVWVGAFANLPGTNRYALPSEIIPAVLLLAALRVRGLAKCWRELSAWIPLALATMACLSLLVAPLAAASKGLTTISLGNNDAADYAAGARVLMEFARTDRQGFLGLTEVVRVMSVDNFFDFWLRLNHFTPSALMAFNGSVLHCAPHEIVGLMTLVIFAGSLPVVFWTARALFRMSRRVSFAVALLYGLSPIPWYAVGLVATGQLLVAPAIALLTWTGVAAWRSSRADGPWWRGLQFFFVAAIGYWLVLGSYNFFLVVCLAPVFAFVIGAAVWRSDVRPFLRWLLVMLAPLACCAVLFADRVAGLVERFQLFRIYDFGWKIPALWPEGWLGFVAGTGLEPWPALIHWPLAAIAALLLLWGAARAIRRRGSPAWLALCVVLVPMAGYVYLEVRGAWLHTNASYDAYKLWAGFFALTLPALVWLLTVALARRLTALFVTLFVGHVLSCAPFIGALHRPPLLVDGELRQLRRIETMPDVKSVNMIFAELDMWSRLWANEFLLRKPQYFLTHTYEGRLNTPLRGDWDLEASRIAYLLPGDGRRQITPRFALVNARDPKFVRVLIGDGWNPEERIYRGTERWQWTGRDATLRVDNPHAYPVSLLPTLDGRSFGERDVQLSLEGQEKEAPGVHLTEQRTKTVFPAVTVPPGRSTLVLHSVQPAAGPTGDDARQLAVCVFHLYFAPAP